MGKQWEGYSSPQGTRSSGLRPVIVWKAGFDEEFSSLPHVCTPSWKLPRCLSQSENCRLRFVRRVRTGRQGTGGVFHYHLQQHQSGGKNRFTLTTIAQPLEKWAKKTQIAFLKLSVMECLQSIRASQLT